MYSNKEREGFSNGIEIVFYTSIFLIFINIYVYAFPIFENVPYLHSPLLRIIQSLNRNTPLFHNSFTSKLLSIFLLFIYFIGNKGIWSRKIDKEQSIRTLIWGVFLFFGINIFSFQDTNILFSISYLAFTLVGYLKVIKGGQNLVRSIINNTDDIFNEENETFPQNETIIENEYSVNYRTNYYHDKKNRTGYVNIVNPFRATMVLGTPGSGKSYSILVPAIKQQLAKGFSMFVYDFKYPTLTNDTYNALLAHHTSFKVKPKFYIINFDDVERSHRCNPIEPKLLEEIMDAHESAKTLMCNLNRTWISKEGDFWVESAINFITSVIWVLKLISERNAQNGNPKLVNVCTLPHVIEFANREYDKILPILVSYTEVENYAALFYSAFKNKTFEQLDGQIGTTRNALARLSSPTLYWVTSKSDFTLDLNNPDEPKILCIGNNPDRIKIYGAALGLFTTRMVKTINKPNKQKCALVIDELPTIYFSGIDNLIATARSNKVATWLGIQDFSQLKRDYGDKEATVIINTVGNIFSGQVTGETADKLSKLFRKTNQMKESITESRQDTTFNYSVQLQESVPANKISSLSQGMFVGQMADNFDEKINLKTFYGEIIVDRTEYPRQEIPIIKDFSKFVSSKQSANLKKDEIKKLVLAENYQRIKDEIGLLINDEIKRIQIENPELLQQKK